MNHNNQNISLDENVIDLCTYSYDLSNPYTNPDHDAKDVYVNLINSSYSLESQ